MLRALIQKIKFFRFVLDHPLNRRQKWNALKRYIFWQVGSRLVPGDVLVPFVDKTFLRVRPGMTGATGNVYTGLHEFEDMAFVLHCLRKGDLFVDIGANIGSYTVLAGGAVGAQCISIEPIHSTFKNLLDNIHLNHFEEVTQPLNIGVGDADGVLRFTTSCDTVNHVLADGDSMADSIEVPVRKLDDLLQGQKPVLIKIDVEGFETNVVKGANEILARSSLLGVIMELNGSGNRYGFDEQALHQRMLQYGFETYLYHPLPRELESLGGKNHASGNTLYLRNVEEVSKRLKHGSQYLVRAIGKTI